MPQLLIRGLSISKALLQASTSSSWARSGNPSSTWKRSSFHRPRQIFTLPARHCELNGPNRVSLSPLSGGLCLPARLHRDRAGGQPRLAHRGADQAPAAPAVDLCRLRQDLPAPLSLARVPPGPRPAFSRGTNAFRKSPIGDRHPSEPLGL